MRAIIIGVPCRGKTTLCNKLLDKYNNLQVMNLGSLRNSLGIHTPHKGFDIEVAIEDLEPYYKVIKTMLKYKSENYIIEGYGLSARKAQKMATQFGIPCILLAHKNTTVDGDILLSRKYDVESKWTHKREEDYLKTLFTFYKSVEEKWVQQMKPEAVFYTDGNFEGTLNMTIKYIEEEYERLKTTD